MRRARNKFLAGALAVLSCCGVFAATPIPEDFPSYQVPGHEQEMETLRSLFWLHYPNAGPQATLWDEWLPGCSLWPGVSNTVDSVRQRWHDVLSARPIDPEGYVATQQHHSIAHQQGWPFPFWNQGQGGFGWHFSFKNTVGQGWRPNELNKPEGWTLSGARDAGINEDGWKVELTAPRAIVTLRAWTMEAYNVPFIQLRWSGTQLGRAQPYIEWITKGQTNFAAERRVYFDAPGSEMTYSMIPMYRHPLWTNEITQIRIGVDNPQAGGSIVIQACFSTYDTRHNINGQNFVRGCAQYFWWTRDISFLRKNIVRMRNALRYLMTEHQALERKVVYTSWIGHDGRPGYHRQPDGSLKFNFGHGIGNNYWDIMPFGNLDCYATIQYYDALQTMARLEREIKAHPEWQIPGQLEAFDPAFLERHAAAVKAEGNRMFWNNKTGRFVACIDADGKSYDYGFTFLNLEAIYYDFATPVHTREIMSWIGGERLVAGDTAQGADIYHWRFAPRATTKRNLDWYFWAWNRPESIPWGGQVQDGGAVLGFSYHDLMARLKARGPDDAWNRLHAIIHWFDEIEAAGGYRKYYDGSREGTMQGSGTAGGLGLDMEFVESAMVPQIMLYGFLGFSPAADGFSLNPRLPSAWPELTIERIRFQNTTLRIRATKKLIEVYADTVPQEPIQITLPAGKWEATTLNENGTAGSALRLEDGNAPGPILRFQGATGIRAKRQFEHRRFSLSDLKLIK